MGRTLIVNSELDPGGSNIKQRLIENFPFRRTESTFDSSPIFEYSNIVIATTKKEIVRAGAEIDSNFEDCTSYVFVSKHWAESKIPSLTAHFTGNFDSADFGGAPKEISRYSPSILKEYLLSLSLSKDSIPSKYNLTLEATHHGPTDLKKPLLFVEIGSALEEWNDAEGGLCVANALMKALSSQKKYAKSAIGFGGTHYPQKFNKLVFETDIAMGIIVPKYALNNVDDYMIRKFVQKSEEEVTMAAVDMKGLGTHKRRILSLIDSIGLDLLKV